MYTAVRRALLLCLPLLGGCSAEGPGEPVGATQQAANVCATGTTLEGVDVSVYDGTVDWAQLKASGRAFATAKASEGSTLKDAQFPTNWPAMKSAGIVRSAYHFFHCDTDPATQATFFLGVMGALEPGDLPPSLDFEDTTTCTASTGISMAIQWLDAVASATGTLPILYTSVNVLSNFQNTQSLAGHAQLWVASRGVTCPDLPAPFTAWSFWQYSLTGTAPGLPNSNGMADLQSVQRRHERAARAHGGRLVGGRVDRLGLRPASVHGQRRRRHVHRHVGLRVHARLCLDAGRVPRPGQRTVLHAHGRRFFRRCRGRSAIAPRRRRPRGGCGRDAGCRRRPRRSRTGAVERVVRLLDGDRRRHDVDLVPAGRALAGKLRCVDAPETEALTHTDEAVCGVDVLTVTRAPCEQVYAAQEPRFQVLSGPGSSIALVLGMSLHLLPSSATTEVMS